MVLEDPRQRVSVGGVPPAGRDQRPGRVRRDELEQRSARAGSAPPAPNRSPASSTECSARRCQSSDSTRFRKPGPATSAPSSSSPNVRRNASTNPLGDLPRRRRQHRREQHRGVRRVIALALAPRPVQRWLRRGRAGRAQNGVRRSKHRGGELLQRCVCPRTVAHSPWIAPPDPDEKPRGGWNFRSSRSTAAGGPIAMIMSPTSNTVSAGGCVSNSPSRVPDRNDHGARLTSPIWRPTAFA